MEPTLQQTTPELKKPTEKKSIFLIKVFLALVVIALLALLFYFFFYKKLPQVSDQDRFEPTIYTLEEQKEILESLDTATPDFETPELREQAVNNFLGVPAN